jgi:membrane-associated PAP2 superfamily phosphatase
MMLFDTRSARLAWTGIAVLALSAIFLLWLGTTRLDVRLAAAIYDQAAGGFPLRHAWFAEVLAHQWLKWCMLVLGAGIVILVLRDAWRPLASISAGLRTRLRVVAACSISVPMVVSVLKRMSASHCPWDIVDYGGSAPYVHLLEAMPAGVAAGHCFPAGHATSVLWLVSLCTLWLPSQPRRACIVAIMALLLGGVVGGIQQLRGAHFLSHTLWSMWIACAVTFLWYQWLTRHEAHRQRRAGQV